MSLNVVINSLLYQFRFIYNLYNFDFFSNVQDLVGIKSGSITSNFEKESGEKIKNVEMIFLVVTTYHVRMSNGLYE